MELPKDLKDKIWNYCRLNDITDLNGFMVKTLKKGFDIEVYGLLGETLNDGEKDLKTSGEREKWVEKEVIVEKRVEIPVEVIKEVIVEKEIIKEVPVEVIKEVEKIVTITNNEELEEKIFHLNQDIESERKIFSTKVEEMENFFQKEMSKKNEELDELRRSLDISLDIKLDDNKEKMLQDTLQKLRKEINEKNQKIKDLETINQELENNKPNKRGFLMKGSNLNDTL
jgi:predicted RNase H-like nuclease (RuvC/YqgF family)